mmetsp:Transcript_31173/g.60751  ORF Transcript_31173/g.60751 Transcript_31173/m.60751 type:complete len:218 (+) Transcript_31173:119-772(+)
MWDIVWDESVAGVFHSPYQSAPLDLDSETFYLSRQGNIDRRIAQLAWTPGSSSPSPLAAFKDFGQYCTFVRELLASAWVNFGTECSGVKWEVFELEFLQEVALGVGPQALACICQNLAKDYSYWSGGLPDLFLWRRQAKGQLKELEQREQTELKETNRQEEGTPEPSNLWQVKLVEVKGPRDTLSTQQKAWLELLAPVLPVAVCHVHEDQGDDNYSE